MSALIVHAVLAILGLRLGLYGFMEWKLLRGKRAVATTAPGGWERFFLAVLPVFVLLMAALVVHSALEIAGLLREPAP